MLRDKWRVLLGLFVAGLCALIIAQYSAQRELERPLDAPYEAAATHRATDPPSELTTPAPPGARAVPARVVGSERHGSVSKLHARSIDELRESPILAEREYAAVCGGAAVAGSELQSDTECAGFDRALAQFAAKVQATHATHGRTLLLRDEFRPIGLAQHWLKRQLALWLGATLGRAVFVQHCDDSGAFARMPRCDAAHFDMEAHFDLRFGVSMAWTDAAAHVAERAVAASAGVIQLDGGNWTSALAEPAASAAMLVMRVLFNRNTVLALRDQLFGAEGDALRAAAPAPFGSQPCFRACSGFAVVQPTRALGAQVAAVEARMRLAAHRVGLHVRTMAADAHACFPDSTPPTVEAVDAAFGNNECMRTAFDHWRFKLVPFRRFDPRHCQRAHLAERTPLSGWLACAARIMRLRGAASAGAVGSGDACATGSACEHTAVFLATDAPALHRFAAQRGALAAALLRATPPEGAPPGPQAAAEISAEVLTLSGSEAIAHTHQMPRAERAARTAQSLQAVFARGAADWYLLLLCDVILAPVESTFATSVCTARADADSCAVVGPRTDFRSGRGSRVLPAGERPECALQRCFPRGVSCSACEWHSEYMGERLLRSVAGGSIGNDTGSSSPDFAAAR